ncbi:unnamed protein product [Thlaspi arvense]|uniref:C3H1-type domain-containing protein n=1 Tax=Thlaspi arvense TaxID=13288 RepID=A0AAU9RKC6_THLAR|nr:unnamed protein product [Thlaspi arvense]
MESYGQTTAMEEPQHDPAEDWSSPGAETGLEEPMWQLGLGGGDQEEEGEESYPERPEAADCAHYLRTGFAGSGLAVGTTIPGIVVRSIGFVRLWSFGIAIDRKSVFIVIEAVRAGGEELPERAGQPVCQYYMRTGTCKYGASCKYHHPGQGSGAVTPTPLNICGYPIRPGEKECSYYMKTGRCKFGPTLASPSTPSTVGAAPIYGLTQLSPSTPTYTGAYLPLPTIPDSSSSSLKEQKFPERPGQPECQYYMKTGDCKFGSSCKYHHPREWSTAYLNYFLSPMGLPIRPLICLS